MPTKVKPKYPAGIQTDMADDKCTICERLFRVHSEREFQQCMEEIVKDHKGTPMIDKKPDGSPGTVGLYPLNLALSSLCQNRHGLQNPDNQKLTLMTSVPAVESER